MRRAYAHARRLLDPATATAEAGNTNNIYNI